MSDQQEDRVGQQVGEYRLVRKLGGGGFGTVYQAEHVHEHAQAAVKVLDIRLTKSEDFKDFINEVRTILLRHPQIVPLLDFGISRNDLPFLVMEYAPEGTLRDRHPRGARIPLPIIVSYVNQIASALQYAHDQRVIHRDVKPENILVRADGTLLVSDFGIAKLMEQSVLLSVQSQVGTPVYMAPEQHLGYPCFASDQYALAVVIYEWICGARPFQGTAVGLAVQHMNTPPLPLRDHLPQLPEGIERVILRALAKAPEERFERIQEFADALREAVQRSMSTVIPSPAIEARNAAPLITPRQVSGLTSSRKSEALGRTLTDSELVSLELTMRTADVPTPPLPTEVKPQEEPRVSVVQNPALLSASTSYISQRMMPEPARQSTAPKPVRKSPLWIKILTVAAIFVLVLSFGSIAFFTLKGSVSSPRGIRIINKPFNQQIGISDGTYAFDTSAGRVDAALKIQAAAKFAQGDKVGAASLWNQAVGRTGIDTSDAEALIYLEDLRILNSGSPYVTLVVGTMLTGSSTPDISEGRDNLQGAYVTQKEYNDGAKLRGGKQVRLLIANAGDQSDYVTEVAQLIVQAVKEDTSIVGVMGWPFSAYALKAAPILGNAHIPMVSSDASTDRLSGISPYFFRVVPPNISQAIAGAKYAEQQLNAKNVALFVDPQDPYCNTLATGFRQQFVDVDGNKIVDTENYTREKDKTNLSAFLQRALRSNPDLIYFACYPDDLDVLLVNFPSSLPNLQVLGGDALYELGSYSSSARRGLSRLRFTAFAYPDEWSILGMKEPHPFFDEYKAAFNPANADHSGQPYGFTRAGSDVILSYDALVVLLQGCQNGLAVKDPLTPDALQKGLTQITGEKAIQGLSGQISFKSNGDPFNKAVVILYFDADGHIHMLEKNGVQGCFVLEGCK
jgi:serine/threonine protein kinase/ABC-type branched-subunit amino acid transport system substrate-binding protein